MASDVRDSRLYQASMLPVNYFSVGAQNCFVLVLVSTLIFYKKNKLKSIKIRSKEFTLVAKLLNSQKTEIDLIIEISESITFETLFNLFSQRRASFTKRIHLQPCSSRYFQSRNMFKKSVVEVRFRNFGIDTTL